MELFFVVRQVLNIKEYAQFLFLSVKLQVVTTPKTMAEYFISLEKYLH